MKILVFEDSPKKLESVKALVNLTIKNELGFELDFVIRPDDSFLDSDLIVGNYSLILIDDDLGNDISGSQVIERIIETVDNTPELKRVSIIYYSAGTSVEELVVKSSNFGPIRCVSFTDLAKVVIDYIKKNSL